MWHMPIKEILKDIPFEIDIDRLGKELHILPTGRTNDDFKRLCREAEHIAFPKAIVKAAYID